MPRGVAIREVREQLFQAAERVLARDGPDGLTSRAITLEAGVAKGLLFNHFANLDDFLTELILDRAGLAAAEAAQLPSLAGAGTVTGNLTAAAVTVLRSDAFAMASIVMYRPSLMSRVREMTGGVPSALEDVEKAFAAYLDAERKLGRIAAEADTETLAFTLIGAIHHLFLTDRTGAPDLHKRVRRIVAALVRDVAREDSEGTGTLDLRDSRGAAHASAGARNDADHEERRAERHGMGLTQALTTRRPTTNKQ
jgi:AcrR family transcriptional regulator